VDAQFTVADETENLEQTHISTVVLFQRGARKEPAIENTKEDRLKEGLVLAVKRTIDKDLSWDAGHAIDPKAFEPLIVNLCGLLAPQLKDAFSLEFHDGASYPLRLFLVRVAVNRYDALDRHD
jgi:hypothetical protein